MKHDHPVNLPTQNQLAPQTNNIDSLINYVEHMETNICLGIDKENEKTEIMITPKVSLAKIQDDHLTKENHIIEYMLPT